MNSDSDILENINGHLEKENIHKTITKESIPTIKPYWFMIFQHIQVMG